MSEAVSDVLADVRRALGRTGPLEQAPVPPAIDEPLTRLVHSEIGLPELFAKIASGNKIDVSTVNVDELTQKLVEFLKGRSIKSIALPESKLLKQLDLLESLQKEGFDARSWTDMTLDELYSVDCGLTDAWLAVAEIGAMLIRSSPEHGRALSLVPPVHVAILEPKNFVPDLIDALKKMPREGNERFVFITGPSKTADIEMNLVTGVHGPGIVKVFILG